jgi:hypothetical protein
VCLRLASAQRESRLIGTMKGINLVIDLSQLAGCLMLEASNVSRAYFVEVKNPLMMMVALPST